MANRIDRFQQQRNATRNLLEWLAVAALATVAALALTCNIARAAEPEGQMLRPGFDTEAHLPSDGWYRVINKQGALQVLPVDAPVSAPGEEEAEAIDTRYIRVPGARIAEGRLPTVAFADGLLVPQADAAYSLALGEQHFTLTVSSTGVLTVSVAEGSYSFSLEGDIDGGLTILAAADIDSDGMPDFIVQLGELEALLLSSRTQPGLNPPAAVFALHGC
jgi:hypothetical protein